MSKEKGKFDKERRIPLKRKETEQEKPRTVVQRKTKRKKKRPRFTLVVPPSPKRENENETKNAVVHVTLSLPGVPRYVYIRLGSHVYNRPPQ